MEKYIRNFGIDYIIIRLGGLKNDFLSGNIVFGKEVYGYLMLFCWVYEFFLIFSLLKMNCKSDWGFFFEICVVLNIGLFFESMLVVLCWCVMLLYKVILMLYCWDINRILYLKVLFFEIL